MLRILLVRHGETEWNRERRIMGKEDVPLNETGQKQAYHMRSSLVNAPLDALYVSPILRAKETAEIIMEERELNPLFDSRLEEVDYGDWVGLTFEEAKEIPGYTPYFQRLNTPVAPNGETLFQVRDRAMDFMKELKGKHSDQTVMVVSHADWIKVVVMEFLGIPFENIWKFRIDNVSVSLVECNTFGDRVICINQRGDIERLFLTRFVF